MAPLLDLTNLQHIDHQFHEETTKHHVLTSSSSPPSSPSSPLPTPKQSTTKEAKSKKHVSFSFFSEMYFVPSSEDMSDEEFEAAYLNDNDYHRIHKEVADTIRTIIRTGRYPEDDSSENCYRGVETHIPQLKSQRRKRVKYVVNTVLNQQQASGKLDPEWVQTHLCSLTTPFARAAHIKGICDTQSVFADLMNDDDSIGAIKDGRSQSCDGTTSSSVMMITSCPETAAITAKTLETKEVDVYVSQWHQTSIHGIEI